MRAAVPRDGEHFAIGVLLARLRRGLFDADQSTIANLAAYYSVGFERRAREERTTIMKSRAILPLTLTFIATLASGVFAQGLQRAPTGPIIIPQPGLKLAPTKLTCSYSEGGDVAAPLSIRNAGPQAVPAGTKISYTLIWPNRPKVSDNLVLASVLGPGGSVVTPKVYPVLGTCTASL
jgi:hypothetical protein